MPLIVKRLNEELVRAVGFGLPTVRLAYYSAFVSYGVLLRVLLEDHGVVEVDLGHGSFGG